MNISNVGEHHGNKLSDPDKPTAVTFWNRILQRFGKTARGHIVAAIGEFAGTILFLFFAFAGTQVANISSNNNAGTTVITTVVSQNPAQLLYISLAFGFSLAVNAWVFFRISGGLFNPAVTFGMWIIGSLTAFRAVLLTFVQIVAAICAAALVDVMFPGDLNVRTQLSPTTTLAQGFFIEMILTAQLVFAIFMLAAEKHAGTFIAPVGIGLALFIAELTGVFWTGGSLNPARSFGPAVVVHEFHSYHWIYWAGPLAGSLLASAIYKLIKSLEYETANINPELESRIAPTAAPMVHSDLSRLSTAIGSHGGSNGSQGIPNSPRTDMANNHKMNGAEHFDHPNSQRTDTEIINKMNGV